LRLGPLGFLLFAPFARVRLTDDASETDVTRRRIHRFGMTRRRAVAPAIARRTQMRAALQNLARDADVRLTWIKAVRIGTTARIARDTARLWLLGLVLHTTVRLAALPRGPTTVVRRTAPPARARISVISSSCSLSCCCSKPSACGTRAEAGPVVAAIRILTRHVAHAKYADFTMEHSTSLDWKLLDRTHRDTVGGITGLSPHSTSDNERTLR